MHYINYVRRGFAVIQTSPHPDNLPEVDLRMQRAKTYTDEKLQMDWKSGILQQMI